MTRRRSPSALAHRRQTRAVVQQPRPEGAATVRLTVKLVLWSVFFAALFTLHAHVGLRTAALQAETTRLERRLQELMDERRQLSSELSEAQDSARVQEIAESVLHMVTGGRHERLLVPAATVAEVQQAAALWWHGGDGAQTQRARPGWIGILAGLWTDHENTG